MKIDIAAKMRELVILFHNTGVGGIQLSDVQPECEDQWSEDYAIICEVHGDFYSENNYFDQPQFNYDVEQLVKQHFSGDPTVKINWHGWPYGCQELEVTRAEPGEIEHDRGSVGAEPPREQEGFIVPASLIPVSPPLASLDHGFVETLAAYFAASDDTQSLVRDLVASIQDPATDADDRDMAIRSIADAIFPF